MNEDQLRSLLAKASDPAWDDDVRATSALFAGKQRVHRRARREVTVGAAVLVVGAAAGLVALIPAHSRQSSDVVLGCAPGVGSTGQGLLAGGVGGVTVSVSNPTREVLSVVADGTSALALPGTSQVTLPMHAGTSTIRCGTGKPVRLTVQHLSEQSHCTSVATALRAEVQRGSLDDLTRAQLGALPNGAILDTVSNAPLQRVQVRASGRVVAEAVWHEMPSDGDWQLESLSHCG